MRRPENLSRRRHTVRQTIEGDKTKVIEFFQKALSPSIPEVQRLAIAQLSKTLAQDAGFGIP
jgi:hypothetical protein